MTPEEHKRIVEAATKPFQPAPESEHGKRMKRAHDAVWRVRDKVRSKNPEFYTFSADYEAIAKAFLEEFHTWPKDELIYVLSILHTEILIERYG